MAFLDAIIGPVAGLLDKLIPDPRARDAAKLELLKLQGTQDLEGVKLQLSAIVAEAQSVDLWAIPMGLIAAVNPAMAIAIGKGMTGYLAAIPEPLYALFGTGYLGYTAAREWGKAKAGDR